MLEVLDMVQPLKNSFAPINRIPPEVLSTIPDYYESEYMYLGPIWLTHVCGSWREIFISRSSLWTYLDFANTEKTLAYIQRLRSSPLKVRIGGGGDETYHDHALPLITPHIARLRSLTIHTDDIPNVLRHFCHHAPLLEDLRIEATSRDPRTLDTALLSGDLSSLRELCLVWVVTHLPWTNMANLRVFYLSCLSGHEVTVVRLLDLFESAPLLHTINIEDSIPESSDAPPERIVSLHHLKSFWIAAGSVHAILNHVRIPIGVALEVWTSFSGEASPLLDFLPETSPNIGNLSHVTTVTLSFCPTEKGVELDGPSGSLLMTADWQEQVIPSSTMDHRILHSISPSILSTTQQLTIMDYTHFYPANLDEPLIFQTFSSMNGLQTLTLSGCNDQPFLFALDPEENSPKLMVCPNLKKITLYSRWGDCTQDLIRMAKGRALRGAKLSSIVMIGLSTLAPKAEVFKLREHVTHVRCRFCSEFPSWDCNIPDEWE